MSTNPKSRAWMEISAPALRRNLERIRESVGDDVLLLPVVKANGYGTGSVEAARTLEPCDPWGFGVATVSEGVALREAGVKLPILVLSAVPLNVVGEALQAGLRLSVSDLALLDALAEACERSGAEARVHIEIDTGMGRSGFDWRTVERWAPAVAARWSDQLRCEGVFTHFHSADTDRKTVSQQANRFHEALRFLFEVWSPVDRWLLHLANSAASLATPELAENLVRPGIFLYGGVAGEGLPAPEDVVALRARILLIRDVPGGTTLGYGSTYRSSGPERWATVGVGYGDGLPRSLGNRGRAIVLGRKVPIIGRISMDLTVVDISDFDEAGPATGTEVTFIGSEGSERISLDEVADLAGTISYEILTGLSPRLPRVWDHGHENKG